MYSIKQNFNYQLINLEDLSNIYEFLNEIKPSIAGLNSNKIYSAICRDALHNNKMIIVTAKSKERVVGIVITLIDWKSYWKHFSMHHPVLAGEILIYRLRRILADRKVEVNESYQNNFIDDLISPSNLSRSWKDSLPCIAKVIFIGVRKDYRGKGIGKQLYNYLFKVLAEKGVIRVDACIDITNISSILFHSRMGWGIIKKTRELFCTIDWSK